MRIMTRLNNKILLVLLAVLLGGFVLSKMFRSPGRESNLKETILKFDTGKISAIHVRPATERKSEVRVVRSGTRWSVENSQGNAKVDINHVKNALSALSAIHPDRLVTRSKNKWPTYQVDSTGTHVKIFTGSEMPSEFWVGSTNSGATCVRLEGDDEVFEIKDPLATYFNKTFSAWRDKTFSRLEPENISSISFQYPGDSSYVVKRDKKVWMMDNQIVDSTKVIRYLSKFRSRTMSEFVDNFVPGTSASFEIIFNNESGNALTIQAWNTSDKDFVVTSSQLDKVYFSTRDASMVRELFPGKKAFGGR